MMDTEASYQAEAERALTLSLAKDWLDVLAEGGPAMDYALALRSALARAERERDQAREALRLIAQRKVPRSARSIADAYRQVSDFAEAALAGVKP